MERFSKVRGKKGWFRESERHALAARGILSVQYPTNHNGSMIIAQESYGVLPTHISKKIPAQESNIVVELKKGRPLPEIRIQGDSDVANLVRNMQDYDREFFKTIYLNSKNKVIGIETIAIGSLNATIIHPREVFKGAILANAAGIITVHNHPSGIATPSEEDKELTLKLNTVAETIGIKHLDHVIVGRDSHESLKLKGLI